MEPEQSPQEQDLNTGPKQSVWNTVTPLSKYLAIALFIILPFVGGYIGYTFAPEKVVEKEVIREVEGEKEPQAEVDQNANSATKDDSEMLDWVVNEDDKISVTFSHPSHWQCNTNNTHIDHPDWMQTICIDSSGDFSNPVLALDTPYVDSGYDGLKVVERTEVVLGGKTVTKTLKQGQAGNTYYAWIFTYGESEEQDSFQASFPFRTDEGISVNEAEELSTRVVESIAQ
jgi:hypothetical protein